MSSESVHRMAMSVPHSEQKRGDSSVRGGGGAVREAPVSCSELLQQAVHCSTMTDN